jgi:hypothetical protein
MGYRVHAMGKLNAAFIVLLLAGCDFIEPLDPCSIAGPDITWRPDGVVMSCGLNDFICVDNCIRTADGLKTTIDNSKPYAGRIYE